MTRQTNVDVIKVRSRSPNVRLFLRLLLIIASATFLSLLLAPSPALAACTCKVEGHINSYSTGLPVVGVRVYLLTYAAPFFFYVQFQQPNSNPILTDSNGYFSFQDSYYISPNYPYYISVNGVPGTLGVNSVDNNFGQWFSSVKTDSSGYANVNVQMEKGTIVNPPFAALYSNTPDVGITFSQSQSATLSNTVSFSLAGSGGSIGFSTTQSATFTGLPSPNTQVYLYTLSYANTFYCAADPSNFCSSYYGGTGLLKSGIGGQVPGSLPNSRYTNEYLTPKTLPSPGTGNVVALTYTKGTWYPAWGETQSNSWSVSLGTSFEIQFWAFSINVHIDTTFTPSTSGSQTLGATVINNYNNPKTYEFYPIYACSNPVGCVGAELHVWDITPPPTCYASASPTSGTQSVTVQFTSSCSGGATPYSYYWQFNDGYGTTSSLQNPINTYYCFTAGTTHFNPTLTVTDANGVPTNPSVPSITVYAPHGCAQSPTG